MTPDILALDFDGVICDGRREYYRSGWQTYCEVWQPRHTDPPLDLETRYIRLSVVIETDRDVPLLVRALMGGIPDTEILADWETIASRLLVEDGLTEQFISQVFAQVRDRWIASDVEDWMSYQPFYSGVTERLQEILDSSVELFIITNRIQRFAHQLLQFYGIDLPKECIFGKQIDRPKYRVLQQLMQRGNPRIWFVEDHLHALRLTQQQPDLDTVELFLTDWGFSTPTVQQTVREDGRIRLLSVTQFLSDFPIWLEDGLSLTQG